MDPVVRFGRAGYQPVSPRRAHVEFAGCFQRARRMDRSMAGHVALVARGGCELAWQADLLPTGRRVDQAGSNAGSRARLAEDDARGCARPLSTDLAGRSCSTRPLQLPATKKRHTRSIAAGGRDPDSAGCDVAVYRALRSFNR